MDESLSPSPAHLSNTKHHKKEEAEKKKGRKKSESRAFSYK
jgi:hypothetical protein